MATRIAIYMTCLWGMSFGVHAQASDQKPIFERDVQPVLKVKCGRCHTSKVRKGDLDLSTMKGIRRGGESGDPMIGASLDESHLWTLIESEEMPPEDQPRLTDDEVAVIRAWIQHGGRSIEVHEEQQQLSQHDVLPIVLLRCTTCHGPRRKDGGLDLRTRQSMIAGGDHGPALIPGDAEASPMIQRIESEACPPSNLLLKFFVRRPPESEVEVLKRWIEAGAPQDTQLPSIATTQPDPLVTDEDRQHWAFQPPRVTQQHASIDQFIFQQLNHAGLRFSPVADRDTLIRRAFIDLIGMPPSRQEWLQYRQDTDSDWYAKMIDDLLASEHYGERWGRYWLDLAGYADSEGGVSADPVRPVAWKYRDYVIDSFNADKPYDRFLIEQLAGDELVDYQNASEITDEMVDVLVATGFLRMGIDETGSRTMNFVPERLKVISDAITVVSTGLMGLTIECARCHSHKYDPIPHRDYYRLKAVFQGALDEHDWSSFKNRVLNVATPEHRAQASVTNPPLDAQVKKLTAGQKKLASEIQLLLLRHHYPEQSEADNKATLVALRKADNNRTLEQKILVERLQKAEVMADADQPDSVLSARRELYDLGRRIDAIRRRMVPSTQIRALWDFGRPSPTYVLRRGEHNKPGMLVGPGVPSVLTDGKTPFVIEDPFPGGTPKTGRRLAFARWLTQPDHPLTSRVIVNRIWYHHFGNGIVKDLENFGVKGSPPTHPELLDWLARRFVDQGWSIKSLHRWIMNSRTYRQSSRVSEPAQNLDPSNHLLSRMPITRLDAEALRDSLLSVSGCLDLSKGGLPDSVMVGRDGLVSVNPTRAGGWRRSIYLQYRRTEIPSMMATFDYPQMGPNCLSRNVSTVSPQSLMLMNNEHIHELSAAFARRAIAELPDPADRAGLVRVIYNMALSRMPSSKEEQLGCQTLETLERAWGEASSRAVETYCHTIFNSASFLYVD